MLRLDFHVIAIFWLHREIYKIHSWKLFAVLRKIKSGRKSLYKKKERKKKQAQRRKKEYHFVKKRKKILCESDWYKLAELHAGVQISNKKNRRQIKICHTWC